MTKCNGRSTGSDSETNKNPADRDYTVGKGRPPKHSQFKPLQSGNPGGKKKGKLNSKTLVRMFEAELLLPRVAFKDRDGCDRTLNAIEAAIASLSKLGVHGDRRASKDIIDLAFQTSKMKEDGKPSPGSLEKELADYRKLNAKLRKSDDNSADDDESWFNP